MKIGRKIIIIGLLLLLVVTGCGRQVSPMEEEITMIRSREEAREIMREFLEEKYDTEYIVNLPSRNENDDYIATAYIENSPDTQIRVAVEAQTGICRDSGCLKALNSYLEDAILKNASEMWDKISVQVNCSFKNEVPNVDRDENDAPETILSEERVNGGIYVMIQKDAIEKEEETALIQRILQTEALDGFYCEFNVYYVSSQTYEKTLEQMQEGNLMVSTSCAEDYNDYMTMFLTIRTEEDYLEEIGNGFKK